MRKLKLLLTATALLLGGGISVWAQTDVTSKYLTNADFEGEATSYTQPQSNRDIYQPTEWEISYTNGESNDMTSLNSETTQWSNFSGKPQPTNGGSKTYWMRFRWGNSENITLSQETSANLEAGTYCVSVDAYSDDNTGTATISVAGVSQTVKTNGAWSNYKVVFTLASAQKVTVSLSYTNTAADDHAAAFDNVKILDLTSEPSGIALKNELGGTSADLSDFIVLDGDYTLEVAGTAGTEITVAADNISYTPEATGTVRFVKKNGIVYVYESASYKKAVNSYIEPITIADITNDNVTSDGSGNLLQNASFETLGDVKSGTQYYPGTPWSGSYPGSSRVQSATEIGNKKAADNGTYVIVWRGDKNNNIGQAISGLKPNHTYKVQARQIYANNGTGAFRFGLGTSVGNVDYGYVDLTLGGSDDKTRKTISGTFVTSSSTAANGYFTMTGCQGGGDKMPCIDWLSLVCQDAFPITGASSASYIYGTAYAPATAKASYLAAKAEAETTIADATYDNVTGSERTALQTAIDADVADNDAAYNTATENIQTAQAAFTAALTHYQALIDAQAALSLPDLAYASTAKKAFITAVATSASDADEKLAAMTTNIRAYYESHAMAEGDATVIDYTSRLTNYNNPSNTSGWTVTNTTGDCKLRTMSNESYTDSEDNTYSYFDTNSWGAAFASTVTQNVALTAGTYLLTVKARGNGTTTYQLTAGGESTDITTSGSTGGVFGRGWNDFSVEFTVAEAGNVTIGMNLETGASSNWLSYGDFRLVKINNTLADATDYSNLNTAITAAKAKTLGFEDGEYAPYENADVLTKLVEAKAINQSANNEQSVVKGLTTYLNTAGNWHTNDGAVAIIYNGTFAEANGTNPKGWTRSNGAWGQQITGLTAATNDVDAETTTAWYYNTNGAWEYGKDDVYKMPLAADQTYKLTFKYRSHENNSNNSMKASVLNDSDEGLAEVTFAKNGDATKFVTATAYFTTGAAGNYVLSLTQNGNTHLTDVNIEKVASTALALNEDETYIPENRTYYETVTLTRTIKADTWNTFCVPFDITNEELVAKFGDEVAVAEFSDEGEDADHVTVNFKKMETPAITANTPVLLKGNAGESFDFSGKLIQTGEAKKAGTYFDFVGTYDATTDIEAGDYFIASNKLYKSSGSTTHIKGTRAYIKAKTAGARIADFWIEGGETTGISTMQNAQFIMHNEVFDLQGRKVAQPAKGLYIKNGKKVVIK